MAITYKTVIKNAIKGFNDIQATLAGFEDLNVNAVSVSDGQVTGSLTPSEIISYLNKMATIKNGSEFIGGKVVYRGQGSITATPTLNETTNTVSFSGSNSNAGYYTGFSTSGSLALGTASVTVTPSVVEKTFDGTGSTVLTNILRTTAPSSYYRVELDPSSTSTASKGYLNDNSKVTHNSGETIKRYIKKASVGNITNGTATNGSATASVAGSLINLGTSSTGLSTTVPAGTAGTNYWTIAPNISTTAGSVSKSSITISDGYVASETTKEGSTVSVGVSGNTGSTYYISKADGVASSSSTTKAKATYSIRNTSSGDLIKRGTSSTGLSTTAPSGTAGTDYWTIAPNISTTAGSVTPSASITTAGYAPKNMALSNGSAVSVSVDSTAGSTYYISKSKLSSSVNATNDVVVSANAGYMPGESLTVPHGTINTGTTNHEDYVQNKTAVVPAAGYLYIGAGYYPNTQISLATLIPNDEELANAGSNQLRLNYEAYDVDGNKLKGTIVDWEPSETYYTTTNTGFGGITGYSYVNSETNYIKAGSHSASITSSQSFTPTISKITTDGDSAGINIQASTKDITTSEPTSGYYIAVKTPDKSTKTFTATSSVSTAGWIGTGNKETSSTMTLNSYTAYVPVNSAAGVASISGTGVSFTPSISKVTSDGANGGVNVQASTKDITTTEPTSGYYIAVQSQSQTAKTITADASITTAGYIPTTYNFEAKTGTVGLNASSVTYIPLTTSSLTTSGLGSENSSNTSGVYFSYTAGYTPGDTFYIKDITIPAGKTLNSVSLTGGTAEARTYLNTLSINGYTTVNSMPVSGIIENMTVTGIVRNMGGTNNRITNMTGTTTIDNHGTSDTVGTMTISNNQYGTVNIWNAGGDKGVQVANHTVKVDGTTVTNSSGDLITGNPSFDGGGLTVPNSTVTLEKGADTTGTGNITSSLTDNGTTEPTSGYYFSIKGNASAITASRGDVLYNGAVNGWVNKGDNTVALSSTTKANSATSATEYFKIPSTSLSSSIKLVSENTTAITNATNISGSASVSLDSPTSGYFYALNITPQHTSTAGYTGGGTADGTSDIAYVSVNKADLSVSATASATTTVAPGTVSISGNTSASVTGKTRVDITPVTDSSKISTYYIPVNASAAANTTGTTSTISGTITADITAAGFLSTSDDKTGSVSGTATAKTSKKDSSQYYIPLTTASLSSSIKSVSENTSSISGATNISGSASVGTSAPTSGYVYAINITPQHTASAGYTGGGTSNGTSATAYVSVNTATFEKSGASVKSSAAGYVPANTTVGTISNGTISKGTENKTSYTQIQDVDIPAGGYLYIGEGYYPNTQISLASLIPDDGDYTNAGNGNILAGYEAYDPDGTKLIGTIPNWNPSSTYYTSTNTGFGGITGYSYVNSTTRYIKKGVLGASAGSDQNFTPTISKVDIASTTDSDGYDGSSASLGDIYSSLGTLTKTLPTSGYYLALNTDSATKTFTATASTNTAGWISTDTASTPQATDSATMTVNSSGVTYIPVTAASGLNVTSISGSSAVSVGTKDSNNYYPIIASNMSVKAKHTGAGYTSTSTEYTDSDVDSMTVGKMAAAGFTTSGAGAISAPSITINTTDGTNSGKNISGVLTKLSATTEPTSGYYIRLNTAGNSTGKTVSTTASTAGYIPKDTSAGSGKVTLNSSDNQYISISEAKCEIAGGELSKGTASGGGLSGGGLTAGSGSVSASGLTLSTTNTSGISVSGSGSVSRAAVTRAAFSQVVSRSDITETHTAGYLPLKDESTVISSTSTTVSLAADSTTIGQTSLSSNTLTKYVTDIAISAGKTLNSVSGAGTITTFGGSVGIGTFSSTGTIGTKSSTSTITTHSGSTTITTNSGTVSVTTNNASKTVTVGTNNGTVNITNPSTGTVNYKDWTIKYNSTNGSLEFVY